MNVRSRFLAAVCIVFGSIAFAGPFALAQGGLHRVDSVTRLKASKPFRMKLTPSEKKTIFDTSTRSSSSAYGVTILDSSDGAYGITILDSIPRLNQLPSIDVKEFSGENPAVPARDSVAVGPRWKRASDVEGSRPGSLVKTINRSFHDQKKVPAAPRDNDSGSGFFRLISVDSTS